MTSLPMTPDEARDALRASREYNIDIAPALHQALGTIAMLRTETEQRYTPDGHMRDYTRLVSDWWTVEGRDA